MGHTQVSCRSKATETTNHDQQTDVPEESNKENTSNGQPSGEVGTTAGGAMVDRFGPWMQASRSRRPARKGATSKGQTSGYGENEDTNKETRSDIGFGGGSRFDILADNEEKLEEVVEINQENDIPRASIAIPKDTPRVNKQKAKEQSKFQFKASGSGARGGKKEATRNSIEEQFVGPILQKAMENRPITIGPLEHSVGTGTSNITAGCDTNHKMRKLEVQVASTAAPEGEQGVALADVSNTYHPGKMRNSGGVKDPILRKPPKNRSGIVLGKRKTDNDSVQNTTVESAPFKPIQYGNNDSNAEAGELERISEDVSIEAEVENMTTDMNEPEQMGIDDGVLADDQEIAQ